MESAAVEGRGKACVESKDPALGCRAGRLEMELASLLRYRRNVGWGRKAWGKEGEGRKLG